MASCNLPMDLLDTESVLHATFSSRHHNSCSMQFTRKHCSFMAIIHYYAGLLIILPFRLTILIFSQLTQLLGDVEKILSSEAITDSEWVSKFLYHSLPLLSSSIFRRGMLFNPLFLQFMLEEICLLSATRNRSHASQTRCRWTILKGDLGSFFTLLSL